MNADVRPVASDSRMLAHFVCGFARSARRVALGRRPVAQNVRGVIQLGSGCDQVAWPMDQVARGLALSVRGVAHFDRDVAQILTAFDQIVRAMSTSEIGLVRTQFGRTSSNTRKDAQGAKGSAKPNRSNRDACNGLVGLKASSSVEARASDSGRRKLPRNIRGPLAHHHSQGPLAWVRAVAPFETELHFIGLTTMSRCFS